MMYPKLNIIPILFAGLVALSSCGTTSNSAFGQVEDDVYFSKKESHKKPVYVPEVDVKEIIKENPPQYGNPNQDKQYYDNGSSNFNYDDYKARQNPRSSSQQYEPEQQEQFLTTVPYAGQEEEAAEASRLRQQYYGNYNTYNYNTYNNSPYYSDPFYNGYGYNNYGYNNYGYYGYNRWAYPVTTIGLGWNSWGGWGLGLGWGWNTGWGYGWPHYNSYWGGPYGCNTWGWNNWCSPYYGNYYGWNNWYGHGYYGNNWGYNGYAERTTPRAQRPRQSVGSNMPRGENYQPRGNGLQTQANPDQPQRTMPRTSGQGQLINRDGQQIYVAPEQNRAMPRTYDSYNRSVNDAERQRQATPPSSQPQQPSSVPRTYYGAQQRGQQPAQYNGNQNTQPGTAQPQQRAMPRYNEPMPQQQQAPQPRNYSPAPSSPAPRPSAPFGGGSSGGGGSRGGGGGGGSRGGSMPRR